MSKFVAMAVAVMMMVGAGVAQKTKSAVSVSKAAVSPALTDAGTMNYIPVFTDASGDLGNSGMYQLNNGTVAAPEWWEGIGTTSPAFNLNVVSDNPPDTQAAVVIDGYGLAGINFIGRRAEGTLASPSQILLNDNIFTMQGRGWFNAVTSGVQPGFSQYSRAYMKFFAAENWTDLAQGAYISLATTTPGTAPAAPATERMRITGNGFVGIGTSAPGSPLEVNGSVTMTNGSGGVLTFQDATKQATAVPSCASGQLIKWNGSTWICFTSTAASTLAFLPNSGLSASTLSGNTLTLGVDTTVQRSLTSGCPTGEAISAINQSGGAPTCVAVGGNAATFPVIWPGGTAYVPDPPNTANGVLNVTNNAVGVPVPASGPPNFNDVPVAVVGEATGSDITTGVTGYATGANGIGVFGWAPNSAQAAVVGVGETVSIYGYLPDSPAVESSPSFLLSGDSDALSAEDCAGSFASCGIYGVGVKMNKATTGTTVGFGAQLASASSVGLELLFAQELNSGTTTGNMIEASTNGGAPYFIVAGNGNVEISGKLTKGSGSFKIDHPLDPANKYLEHSFVESPDMMNIYNGVIVLDKRGKAEVQLPDYFEALNQDFRYQLTAIGAPGPNLFVASEIKDNKFVIAGGKPGAKVSWQVTGIRHDAYAEANRIKVEEDKGDKRGTYIHPELFQKNPVVARE